MNLIALIHVRRVRGREPTRIRVSPRARFLLVEHMLYDQFLSMSFATIEVK